MSTSAVPALAYCGKAPLLAEKVVKSLAARKKMVVGAESCTAGLASDFIASIPGASDVFWGCFVTYSADAKVKLLGVQEDQIEAHGLVSRPVALAMAEGALEKSGAFWAFSITGFAGPSGGSERAPVGTVWIGIAGRDGASGALRSDAKRFLFSGSRNEIREAAAVAALQEVLERVNRA